METTLQLKPTHKAVRAYYQEIEGQSQLSLSTEGAVSPAFAGLLRHCAGQFGWTLTEEFAMKRGDRTIRVDGAVVDGFKLVHGVWEAKDSADDLEREVRRKFEAGYPRDNILFQSPDRAIVWQDGQLEMDVDISKPDRLIEALKAFFEYQPPAYEQWDQAVEEFKLKVPELAEGLLQLIEKERRTNRRFIEALDGFTALCREAINPNLSTQAVEEMLIQHVLTERIFRRVFNNPDFVERNFIAREIEKVIQALTAPYFSRHEFLKPLDRFYGAIENTAATIDDFSQKQGFLNTVYEKFFQGFSIKVADTHGIVYTPQPIVNFMVHSVEHLLQREFGRSLSDAGVSILDPFVGTGNFIVWIMREMRRTALPQKYAQELFCNEVMLLPYYIASMNIEHAYYDLTRQYESFQGICLVDTFELAEARQMPLFTQENTERVARQKAAPIFVIVGNPPYNAKQVNENDNNKNRRYPVIDARVAETYARDSRATNKNALSDVYVKAIRWASDRLAQTGEGIVAFVSNNSFIDGYAFDGMREHLEADFDAVYVLDLGGNVRENPKLSGTTHNVFGIQVGVSISFFVKKKKSVPAEPAKIFYARVDEFWRKEQKYDFLEASQHCGRIEWQRVSPDAKHTWLTAGLRDEFDAFVPMGTKEAKSGLGEAIFENYGRGVATCRDTWAYNFDCHELERNIRRMIEVYNDHVFKWARLPQKPDVDGFVSYEDARVSWSEGLKKSLKAGILIEYDDKSVRNSMYRPFVSSYLYFDKNLVERRYQMPSIFPTPSTESENRVICVNRTSERPFCCLMANAVPDLVMTGGFGSPSQCFPFYTYDEDGSNRRENVTDWALERFRARYEDGSITKWDVFHYVYGVLHHPQYRERYAANLRRDLPRLPFAPNFWAFARAGAELAALHVDYEAQPEYPLEWVENRDATLNWRVEKMRLSADRSELAYNDFLKLTGIPPAAFEYRLGNRSALDWLVDQYRVKTDRRSGIVNDPNRPDDPQYIVRLVGKVVTVSLRTVEIVRGLPPLE